MMLVDGDRVVFVERRAVYYQAHYRWGEVVGNIDRPEVSHPWRDVSERECTTLKIYPDGEGRLEPWLTSWRLFSSVTALKIVRDLKRDLYKEKCFQAGPGRSNFTREILEVFFPDGAASLPDVDRRFGRIDPRRRRSVYDTECVSGAGSLDLKKGA